MSACTGLTSFRRITIDKTLAGWRRDTQPASPASRVGFEPTTKGLKVPCSATELPAREGPYHVPIGRSALPGDKPATGQAGTRVATFTFADEALDRHGDAWTLDGLDLVLNT